MQRDHTMKKQMRNLIVAVLALLPAAAPAAVKPLI